MILKDELRKLSAVNRELLMTSFEAGLDRYIVVRDNIFVGVHLVDDPKLDVLHTEGAWSCGRLKTPPA